jgi:hypothetical protein
VALLKPGGVLVVEGGDLTLSGRVPPSSLAGIIAARSPAGLSSTGAP